MYNQELNHLFTLPNIHIIEKLKKKKKALVKLMFWGEVTRNIFI